MFALSLPEMVLRLALACALGGIVGIERETVRKPAGLRTHVLVCMGSTMTMLTSLFIYESVKSMGSTALPDPARLGAQVISGIGFLGAGTIIKEGVNVRGLTTAASLWTVACIGLAIGVGYYEAALIATGLVLVVLLVLNKIENMGMFIKHNIQGLVIIARDQPGLMGAIGQVLGDMGVSIYDIKIKRDEGTKVIMSFSLKLPGRISKENVVDKLYGINGIDSIKEY